MALRIGVLGGSLNPSGIHHRNIAEFLSRCVDRLIIPLCGPRPDKETTNDTLPIDRATIADLTFSDIPHCEVDLFDLENDHFTPTWKLCERYASQGDVYLVVGADLVRGGHSSEIYTQWERGAWLWENARFAVAPDGQGDIPFVDLPPQCQVLAIESPHTSRSTLLRHCISTGSDFRSLVVPAAHAYIERYRLYRRASVSRVGSLQLETTTPVIVVSDERNEWAQKRVPLFHQTAGGETAEAIVSIGGDGTMLRAIRQHWRKRLPFIGLNAGHRGFLLHDYIDLTEPFTVYHSPLLHVEMQLATGEVIQDVAFNDAWMQCQMGTTGWMRVLVNGTERIERLVGDGLLVATAAGSTGYARAMGASPILIGTPSLIIAGSNVAEPPGWRSAQIPLHSTIKVETLDSTLPPRKRALFGFVDGRPQGEVLSMEVRMSRVAAVELAFNSHHDIAAKVSDTQFPVIQN